ncbi:hypothetical protein KXD40_005857 [Peronospora effusa]|uniref:Uncharacterized protein n=1 Tax=Peronospora effusa TaxID=542832 RepID=A0A3M6VFY4_9STRA|nr:hypothetical protein DD238_003170 [Peronospora effusa]UIZ27332.1 hypothetical protein KXD40_005857 [Peronospora effusa]
MSSYKNSVYIVSEGVAKLNPQMTLVQFYGCLNNKQGFTCDAMTYASNVMIITQAKAQKDILMEVEHEMT